MRSSLSAYASLAGRQAGLPGMRDGLGGRPKHLGANTRIHRLRPICEYSASAKIPDPGHCRATPRLGAQRPGTIGTGRKDRSPAIGPRTGPVATVSCATLFRDKVRGALQGFLIVPGRPA